MNNPDILPRSNSSFSDIFSSGKRSYLLVLLLAVAVNIGGLFINFFTNDPGLYALLAKTMVQSGNYTDLMYRGADWLDKPHFPFWMIALSFNVFGISAFAYKLPALLFYFVSVIYTYKLAKKLYNMDTALMAVLILLTAQHAIMSNTDVRAEPYIMGMLMGSVYHFYKLKQKFSIADLFIASAFAACAVMTKGIYVLIPIGTAIVGEYVFTRNFKGLLQWRWVLAIMLVAIFTLPEVYTLYLQFDAHPEKVVFGHQHVSGIRWFLWDSQFGRFNSTGYIIRPAGDKFFFLHTLLWAFAPWALLLYAALLLNFKKVFKRIALPEYVTLAGTIPMLLIFSVSAFQLPFYTNILFPLFAIIAGGFVTKVITDNKGGYFKVSQFIITGLLVLLLVVLNFVFAPGHTPLFCLLTLVLLGGSVYIFKTNKLLPGLFLFTCCVAVWANTYIEIIVYPELLKYKGDVNTAEYINKHYSDNNVFVAFNIPDSFEFYTKQKVSFKTIDQLTQGTKTNDLIVPPPFNELVVANDDVIYALKKKRYCVITIIKQFNNYPNENLTLPFIIEKDRGTTLDHFYLINLTSPGNN